MSLHITRCPGCGSSFNTNDSVLESAQGKARCGACLTVFDARKYLVKRSAEQDDEGGSVFLSPPTEFFDPAGLLRSRKPAPSTEQVPAAEQAAAAQKTIEVPLAPATEQMPAAQETEEAPAAIQETQQKPTVPPSLIDRSLSAIPEESLRLLSRLSAPLEFLRRRHRRGGGVKLLLFLTALLLTATLAAQVLWVNRHSLSQQDRFRGLYDWACERYIRGARRLLGERRQCDLPPFSSLAAIDSSLSVRGHPDLDNVLILSITLRNTASFPQPFPLLILDFTTADGRSVALRQFAPEEYLPPGLQRIGDMPVMNPVQIRMDLMDPGPDAVNYTLGLQRP